MVAAVCAAAATTGASAAQAAPGMTRLASPVVAAPLSAAGPVPASTVVAAIAPLTAAESTDPVAAAAAALAQTNARLNAAAAEKSAAASALEQARTADAKAQADLAAATTAEAEARAAVAKVTIDLNDTNDEVGRLARAAYMSGGDGANQAGFLLGAVSPEDLLSRAQLVNSVAQSQNATLDELAGQKQQLRQLRNQRLQARQDGEDAAQASAKSLQEAQARQDQIAALEGELATLAGQQQAALAEAQRVRAEDEARAAAAAAEARALAAALAARNPQVQALSIAGINAVSHGALARPATGRVTSPFGMRMHPVLGYERMHTGVDFGLGDGVIYAAGDGVVAETRDANGYGLLTVIQHASSDGKELSTWYAHQARFLVSPGERVKRGQPIGMIGSTGISTGAHLHFEVRVGGEPTDPLPWVGGR